MAQHGMLTYLLSCLLQREVEDAFIGEGHLSPQVHKSYWLGLRATAAGWPTFK